MFRKIPKPIFTLLLCVLPIITALACIGIGRYSLSMKESFQVLFKFIFHGGEGISAQDYSVVINMRLPRILMALICGGGLAAAGASLQATFSNPMVSPDTLGVASGASFGAALALLLDGNIFLVQILALFFGIVAMLLTLFISKKHGKLSIIMLILTGMVVSALFQALVSLAKYTADTEDRLPAITYWLMGSLNNSTFRLLATGAPPIIASVIVLFLARWKINVLSLSEDEAHTLGVNVNGMRTIMILAATMITASVVSMCGQIGWVGLLAPHAMRMLFGSNNQKIIPASISFGAVFLLVMDTIARSATSAEIPISILTAVIGAPCFIILLKKTGGEMT